MFTDGVLEFVAAKRLFKIWRFTIGAPRAVIVSHLRGSLVLSKSDVPAYNFFENFCEFVLWLEKPKSGEISDVLILKVGDRGATADSHTPYFQVASLCSSPHGSYIDSSDSPVVNTSVCVTNSLWSAKKTKISQKY